MTIHFGTDGWRAVISDTFTFHNLRLVTQAIADAVASQSWNNGTTCENLPDTKKMVVGFDTRFLSDRYAQEVARVSGGDFSLEEMLELFLDVVLRTMRTEHGSPPKSPSRSLSAEKSTPSSSPCPARKSAYDGVETRTVVPKSCIMRRCRSVRPEPAGMIVAPIRSMP